MSEPTIGPPQPPFMNRARRIEAQRLTDRLAPLAVEITKGWKPEAHERVIRAAFERAGLNPTAALVARLGWRTRAARAQRIAEYQAAKKSRCCDASDEAVDIVFGAHRSWVEPEPTVEDEMLAADKAHAVRAYEAAYPTTTLIKSLKRKLDAANDKLVEEQKMHSDTRGKLKRAHERADANYDELEKTRAARDGEFQERVRLQKQLAIVSAELNAEVDRRDWAESRLGVRLRVGSGATGRKPFAQDGVAGDPLAVYERLEPMPAAYVEERLRAVSDGLARGDYVPDSKGNCERAIYRLVNLLSQKFRGDGA